MLPFVCLLGFVVGDLAGETTSRDDDDRWIRMQLDERFRSEGVTAADINGDGTLDVVAGDVWYQAPRHKTAEYSLPQKWRMHELRAAGRFVAGQGYSNSFANVSWDFNKDGHPDVCVIGFPGDPFYWYENPGLHSAQGKHWKEHLIWTSICNESPEFEDLDGDGIPEFVFGSQPEAQMGFTTIPTGDAVFNKFDFRAISKPSRDPRGQKNRGLDNGSFKYYHGLGIGDLSGDGHPDVVIGHGWWESPGQLSATKLWKFHPIQVDTDGQQTSLPKASNIYTDDFDSDGDADLFLSSAHEYGVWWAENQGNSRWKLHEIDRSYSQTHAVERADINGDGQLDYVTGKRFFAHNGRDPGGKEEVVMYWYEVIRRPKHLPKFIAHRIIAGNDTGIGTQFEIKDMNADGKPDIVLSNKKGVNLLLQK